MERKVCIVTGASSGIGKALAIEFASKNFAVIASARRAKELQDTIDEIKLAKGEATPILCDVSIKQDCESLIEQTIQKYGRIDVLINNAGISMRSVFGETKPEVIEQLMQVNFMGAVYCTRYALEHVIKTKGSIIGISSIAGYRGLPARTGYSASKFALRGFLQSLRLENRKHHLHVMEASPGYTSSNIRKTALLKDGSEQGETPLEESKIMSANAVAEAIFRGYKSKKNELVLTRQGRLVVALSKLFPKFVDNMIFKNIKKEPGSPF
jgi:short-subunit dehydrogenase